MCEIILVNKHDNGKMPHLEEVCEFHIGITEGGEDTLKARSPSGKSLIIRPNLPSREGIRGLQIVYMSGQETETCKGSQYIITIIKAQKYEGNPLHELKGLQHDGMLITTILHQCHNSSHLKQCTNIWEFKP